MSEFSDQELLDAFFGEHSNRHYAFNLLVRKYQQKIYYHIRRMVIDHDDTNDVVQNTFVKAWRGLENFRRDSQLYTWLYRIATNEALTFIKQKKNRLTDSLEQAGQLINESFSTNSTIDANKLEVKLQQAILKLPEQQRIVFNMRYYDEVKYEEMSKMLGVTEGALKASYHHAVKKIEKMITED